MPLGASRRLTCAAPALASGLATVSDRRINAMAHTPMRPNAVRAANDGFKDRVDDAMHATRAAVEEGVVPGGGSALLYAIRALDKLTPSNPNQKVGIEIVRKALSWPARQIAENSGADGSIVVGKLLESKDANYGYDAQKGEFTDMIKAGIIDPTKVVRHALQDAASIAGLLITTEAMVAEKPEPKTPPAVPPGGMGGMGGMDY
jgi:chaperonin GroEL